MQSVVRCKGCFREEHFTTSLKGDKIMSKGEDSKKTEKKAPAKTPKEKKADKKIKKAEKKK
jgi:hypothetical protein